MTIIRYITVIQGKMKQAKIRRDENEMVRLLKLLRDTINNIIEPKK